MKKEYKPGEEEWYKAAMNLDIEFFNNKTAVDLIENHADAMIVCHAKYGFLESLITRLRNCRAGLYQFYR